MYNRSGMAAPRPIVCLILASIWWMSACADAPVPVEEGVDLGDMRETPEPERPTDTPDLRPHGDTGADSGQGNDAGHGLDGGTDGEGDATPDGRLVLDDDIDNDGLSNECEDSVEGLDAVVADSDGDGLDDGEEDLDRDCVVDPGETDPTMADTDGDNIDDGEEINYGTIATDADTDNDGLNDGVEVLVTETDPLDPDTDDDGCLDGAEDRDGDGLIGDCELGAFDVGCADGETDPLDGDTDGDGIGDCGGLQFAPCDPGDLVDPLLIRSEAGDYTLALPTDVVTGDIGLATTSGGLPVGTFVDDAFHQNLGFAMALPAPFGGTDLDVLSNYLLSAIEAAAPSAVVRTSGRTALSHDGYDTLTSIVIDFPTAITPGALRRELVASISGDATSLIDSAFDLSVDATGELVGVFQLLARSDEIFIVIGAVASASDYDDEAATTSIRMDDLAGGSAIAGLIADLFDDCVGYVVGGRPQVDFIWSLDPSSSMLEQNAQVQGYAATFVEILDDYDIDYRFGVTAGRCKYAPSDPGLSTELLSILEDTITACSGTGSVGAPSDGYNGNLCDLSFSDDATDFASCIGRMSLEDPLYPNNDEYTLGMAAAAIDRALPRTVDSATHLRPDAEIVLVVVTDEHGQVFEDSLTWMLDGVSTTGPVTPFEEAELDALADRFLSFFGRDDIDATVFGVYWIPGEECFTSSEVAFGIHEVVGRSGGTAGSVCRDDITATLEEIAVTASALASEFRLIGRPVALTLQTTTASPGLSPETIARSRVNGFDYDPVLNRVVFQGDATADPDDEVIVTYQRWEGGIIECESNDDCPLKFDCIAGECI